MVPGKMVPRAHPLTVAQRAASEARNFTAEFWGESDSDQANWWLACDFLKLFKLVLHGPSTWVSCVATYSDAGLLGDT